MIRVGLEIIPGHIKATKAYQFAVDVTTGKLVSGKKRIQACQRFLDELVLSCSDPKYPWEFDVKAAFRPSDFIERFLIPTKGA